MEFLTKYYSGDQIEKNEMGDHVECIGEEIFVEFWVEKPEGKETTWKSHT